MKNHWLRNCDFLNIPMSLSYKNENFYATNIGAVLTIFCFIIIISISSYEIKELQSKSNFSIISNEYTDLSEKVDFSKTPLLFQMANDYGEIIDLDEKLYELKAYDIELIIQENENGKRKKALKSSILELETCDKVLSNISEYSLNLNLSKYMCFKSGQNLTSYGLLGDTNNGFKGFRIYLNKCNGKSYCYNDSVIMNKLQNSKFIVTYLSLNTNIFNLDIKNLKYQLFSKSCSISTNILKKIYFTYNIGRFYLYNNILFKKKITFNYIIGNSQIMDIDADPRSTMISNSYTLAYISFHYSGNIIEISKEVQRLFDTIVVIGNTFNIVLTILKIINNYYSNKILFADIFKSIFFNKEININLRENNIINNFRNLKNFTINRKKNLDISDEIGLNSNINKINIIKRSSKKVVETSDKNNINIGSNKSKKKSFLFLVDNKGKINKDKLIYFYFIPYWILKKHKTFNNICLIKDRICSYFSIEKLNELIKFKENMENKDRIRKMSYTQLIQINNKNNNNITLENNSSNKDIK